MPNWCMNRLEIIGTKIVMEEIISTGLSLDEIVPTPEELTAMEKTFPVPNDELKLRKSLEARFGCSTAYDWHVAKWGTKWDIGPFKDLMLNTIDADKDIYEINLEFDSAWSPPVLAMQALYNKYKDTDLYLKLEYFEPGCAFVGVATGEKGSFDDECYEYSNADELEKYVNKLKCYIAEGEIDFLRESENEESDEVEVESAVNEK